MAKTLAELQAKQAAAIAAGKTGNKYQNKINAMQGAAPVPGSIKDLKQGVGGLGAAAGDLAMDQLGQFSQPFNPNLTNRSSEGDVLADRQRIEDDVFARLTRDVDANFGRDKEMLEQRLAEQGIQFDPNPGSRYSQEMKLLNDRYDGIKTEARQRATEMGGVEYQRDRDINETMRANDYGIQSGARSQNFGEFGSLAGMNSSALASLFNIKGAKKQRKLQKFLGQLQANTAKDVAGINSRTALGVAGINNSNNDEDDGSGL